MVSYRYLQCGLNTSQGRFESVVEVQVPVYPIFVVEYLEIGGRQTISEVSKPDIDQARWNGHPVFGEIPCDLEKSGL